MERRQQQFYALGSQAYITLIAETTFDFEQEFAALHSVIASFEQRFSRFLPDSELTKFNENAGSKTEISLEFRKLLLACKNMSETTDDFYNPFVLPALQKAGYRGSWPSPANLADAKDFSDRKVVPSAELTIYEGTAIIPAGTALDFGGIGKGYLLDDLNALLQPFELHGYWLSLGGDIVCAGGDLENEWAVQVQAATGPEEAVTILTNHTGTPTFIATSGITKRRGDTEKGSWHHIIDPKTGTPAQTDILTATVTSGSGVEADIYAKTIVIAGSSEAKNLKDAGHIRSYILQYEDKEPTIEL